MLFSYLAPLSKISPCEWPKKTEYIRTESTPQNISCVKFKWNLACLVCSAHGNHERKTEKVTLQVAIYVSWKDKKLKKYEDRIWRSSTAGLDIQKNRWEIKTSNNVQAWSWGISALDFSEDHKETRVNWLENSSVALPQDSWHEGLFNRQCHCNFSFALEMLWILAVFINVRLDDQNKSICMNFDQFGFFPYNICQNDLSITIFVYEWKNIAVHIGVQL